MDDVETMVWNIVRESAKEFVSAPGAIDIVRNGGWEGDIQSTILRQLGQMERILGIVEGQHRDITRIDVVAHPVQGGLPLFALELKANHAQQGALMTSNRRLDACNQLSRLLVQQVPCFLVYTIADLWIDGDADPVLSNYTDDARRAPPVSVANHDSCRPDILGSDVLSSLL